MIGSTYHDYTRNMKKRNLESGQTHEQNIAGQQLEVANLA